MRTDLTVACVFKPNEVYRDTWVLALQKQVRENLGDHRFVCLTDEVVEGVECIPLINDWDGWWNKIELFRPGLLTGPTLYLDLDVLVTGSLAGLFRDGPGFSAVQDFYVPEVINSSVMAWEGDYGGIYSAFERMSEQFMTQYGATKGSGIGDQAFIFDHMTGVGMPIDRFPQGSVVSWKRAARHFAPDGARVVAFHGKPKMPDAEGWARKQWHQLHSSVKGPKENTRLWPPRKFGRRG